MMIRLEVMRSFVAVYECGSVTHAARRQGYSPAAVSRQIGKLQRTLGVALFEPDGRGIRPTAHAARLAELARDMLVELDRLESCMTSMRGGQVSRPADAM